MSLNESSENIYQFKITDEDHDNFKRLDQFLAKKIESTSRSVIKDLFLKNQILFG